MRIRQLPKPLAPLPGGGNDTMNGGLGTDTFANCETMFNSPEPAATKPEVDDD